MENGIVAGKTIEKWVKELPLLEQMMQTEEVFWTNPNYHSFDQAARHLSLGERDVKEAEERLARFAPYIAKVFPETQSTGGIIESPLVKIPKMQRYLEETFRQPIEGEVWLKCDSHLPISGSIKARGGIYEVLKHAEDLALANGMISVEDDYTLLANEEFRQFFSRYSLVVGSTGNLGLSIGIIGARLGFHVTVHMSSDAKQWKKELLRSKGVTVVEHLTDYNKVVEEARRQSAEDPTSYFIDDENSTQLFLGYAVAALRLKQQLEDMNIIVDEEHPLFVYLPCGVGGGPGGVTFGLKLVYGDHVHCFFAEPTHSPCMLLGLMTGEHDRVSVQDFGIDNKTEADGLAVGRPSGFVGKMLENAISGVYTVDDSTLYQLLAAMIDTEKIRLEPSALAGVAGPVRLCQDQAAHMYLEQHHLKEKMNQATHICWATGGSMVPKDVMDAYYKEGKRRQRG
ncbi:D-serine ammonia-lyase [Geobacillus thermodenitrificans]|jgi:D-serine dehydratase|uniref:Probable D-serine dehydratase n=1 Tax=Geobacillus thermodenitrificans (strain NG80-2) TaxID=420246 RepID=A4IPD9_GEOTN|nr:D-serine ammonia-lyase [Geobacillus thermodenitrificans]ABO67193.1 D-serine dehydratase [Geobacillus thermodenitrificans NG80-2]MEC5186895.1 D-serine dehydratase [Geobacillus thermodenitrificans]MED0661973.1 D-serine ammonia-lyase [Geobacillus thermodenitrificans]